MKVRLRFVATTVPGMEALELLVLMLLNASL